MPTVTDLNPIGRCSSVAWTGFTTMSASSTCPCTPESFRGATTPVHLDTSEQMEGMVQRAAGKRMTYELLIGPVESRLQEGLTG